MPDHASYAERAEQRARSYPVTSDVAATLALLAIYHLLEERLPKPRPVPDASDIGHVVWVDGHWEPTSQEEGT